MARKPKPHPWGARLGWFPCPYFTLCVNEAQFAKAIKHLKVAANDVPDFVKKGGNATTHFFTRDRDVTAIVTLGSTKGRTLADVTSLLAHEATHLWQEARDSAGEKKPSSELEAYAIQHFVRELVRLYQRLK